MIRPDLFGHIFNSSNQQNPLYNAVWQVRESSDSAPCNAGLHKVNATKSLLLIFLLLLLLYHSIQPMIQTRIIYRLSFCRSHIASFHWSHVSGRVLVHIAGAPKTVLQERRRSVSSQRQRNHSPQPDCKNALPCLLIRAVSTASSR